MKLNSISTMALNAGLRSTTLDHQMELSPSCLMRKHAEAENRMSPHGKVLDYDFSSVMHECEPF